MAYSIVNLENRDWTLIGNNVSSITVQNQSYSDIYIAFTSTNTAPAEDTGLLYPRGFGETNRPLSDLTDIGNNYVWARGETKEKQRILVGA